MRVRNHPSSRPRHPLKNRLSRCLQRPTAVQRWLRQHRLPRQRRKLSRRQRPSPSQRRKPSRRQKLNQRQRRRPSRRQRNSEVAERNGQAVALPRNLWHVKGGRKYPPRELKRRRITITVTPKYHRQVAAHKSPGMFVEHCISLARCITRDTAQPTCGRSSRYG